MPITPLHLVAGVGIKAAEPKRFSYLAFAVTNVLIDLDSAWGLIEVDLKGGRESIHGAPHSFLFATLIALVVYAFMRKRKGAMAGAMIGGWSHILLDSFYHSDVVPFLPYQSNPLYGLIDPLMIDWLCVAVGVLIPAYIWRHCKNLAAVRAKWYGSSHQSATTDA